MTYMERQYFIRYLWKDHCYGNDLALLTKEGCFNYGETYIDGNNVRRYEHVKESDIALFTKEDAELMVKAFSNLFIEADALSEDELSYHHIDTIQDTWNLYGIYRKQWVKE